MKKILLLLLTGTCLATSAFAQQKYWLLFDDKGPEAAYWAENPQQLLSEKALERRARIGSRINATDYPVSQTYLKQLRDAGVKLNNTSKWINAVSVQTTLGFQELQAICPQIGDMRPVGTFVMNDVAQPDKNHQFRTVDPDSSTSTIDYGAAVDQITMLNLDCLHDRGFTGRGVLVAVFDAGFFKVDSLAAFDSLWNDNRVLTYYDFVNSDSGIFDEASHGLAVLSTIATNQPGIYVGTAPHIDLAMARTENIFSETHQEEDNWLSAVEWADSLGADIIQSSLGYNTFDAGEGDYEYADMNGDSAIVTRAADLAASKGILVVNSAGNEGNGQWHYITAPCDADTVLCVGAVDMGQGRASFSSVGPTADGRIKPDVMAMGSLTAIISTSGTVTVGSGTSYAAPQMAGFAACLMQAHPQRSNVEVIRAITESSDRFLNPDTAYGYGIPDACKADSILTVYDSLALSQTISSEIANYLTVYPNPAKDMLFVEAPVEFVSMEKLEIISADGKSLMSVDAKAHKKKHKLNIKAFAPGMYILKISYNGGKEYLHKFIHQ